MKEKKILEALETVEYTLTLQTFAAGDVVNYSGDGTDANAGSFNVNSGSAVSTGDLAVEMKEFYNKALIALADAKLVHDQFGKKQPIPKNGGRSIEWRKFTKLNKALTPITEGVTPTGNKLKATNITASIDQYGDYVEQTDLLEMTAVDNTIVEATKELSSQAGLTIDTLIRNELVGGANVMYVPKRTLAGVETAVTSRADLDPTSLLTVKDVFKASAILKSVNAPMIDGSYVAIIHPEVAYDLMMNADKLWIDIQKYTTPDNRLKGEIGKLGGVRFVESTEAKRTAPAEISDGFTRLTVKTDASASTSVVINEELTAATPSTAIPVYVNGVANTITQISTTSHVTTLTLGSAVTVTAGKVICGKGAAKDGSAVYATLFLGANAYGLVDIEGGGMEHIVKQRGYGNDPLNQRSSVGWKCTFAAKRLIEEYILRAESCSSFSAAADSN